MSGNDKTVARPATGLRKISYKLSGKQMRQGFTTIRVFNDSPAIAEEGN
jgi:hypothetical protein